MYHVGLKNEPQCEHHPMGMALAPDAQGTRGFKLFLALLFKLVPPLRPAFFLSTGRLCIIEWAKEASPGSEPAEGRVFEVSSSAVAFAWDLFVLI